MRVRETIEGEIRRNTEETINTTWKNQICRQLNADSSNEDDDPREYTKKKTYKSY